jgi:N-acyl amino acid synthase of PEP-CTERM/exosortase system
LVAVTETVGQACVDLSALTPDPYLAESLSPHFHGLVLDGDPALINESYRLRYQVYCHERHFLPAEDYPTQLEIDAYDRYSLHVGVLNKQGSLVATARMVRRSELGFPLLLHCAIDDGRLLRDEPQVAAVEISRLAVSRNYNRRAGDHFYSLQGPDPRTAGDQRKGGGEIVMELYKAVYQASKRRGCTHWLMAAEPALRRLLARIGVPFYPIGPESDYYGVVSPYGLDLRQFDEVITSGRIPILAEFLHGLEPEFAPVRTAGRIEGGDGRSRA